MPHCNVPFLCTGNSARSIMAEAIMNRKGRANFTAFSAGSHPARAVRPEAIRQLEKAGSTRQIHAANHGTSSRNQTRPISVSYSRFATTQQKRYARSGLGSR
jgi:protein-tyrosine-phosphatase